MEIAAVPVSIVNWPVPTGPASMVGGVLSTVLEPRPIFPPESLVSPE